MSEPHKWARWAASGGGQRMAEWSAIVLGILVAVVVFRSVSHWWVALPAAILSWFLANWVVAGIWALIRRLIEVGEGIR